MTSTPATPPPDPTSFFDQLRGAMTSGRPDEPDPFAHVHDDDPLGDNELRTVMLERTRRTHVPLRKIFVQQPMTSTVRPSLLGEFVNSKKLLPLRTLLLVHALEPMLEGTYWTLGVWARLIGGTSGPQSPEAVSKAFRYLAQKRLIVVRQSGQAFNLTPLHESGTETDDDAKFVRASALGADVGHGYLTIPVEFWKSGLVDRLKMPGLAMFLLCLSETTEASAFQVSQERMQAWYGLSERTAERGYGELRKEKVLLERRQMVNEPNSPTTRTARYHRALAAPYSTAARAREQQAVRDRLRQASSDPDSGAAAASPDAAPAADAAPATEEAPTVAGVTPAAT
ncbi:hypothetical protein [Cellulomonas sp. Y8]|uniref:hypothetical protein n=1 Tax=Cellulomonas sp. Y8 TaxID=2591145 RepID=UPI003D702EDB